MTLREIFKTIDRREWLFLTIISIVLLFITSIPYLYGQLTTPSDTYYLAVSRLNRVDYPNYFSYIEQVKDGHLLFKDLYTTESQPRIILNLFFLGLGILAKLFNFSALQIFHFARIFLAIFFLIIVYIFIAYIFKEKQKRKIAFLFVCFSSGLSFWLLAWIKHIPLQSWPMDLWISESITFLSLYTNPLFTCSLIMIVVIFFLMLLALKNKNWQYAFVSGIVGLLLFQIHPYDIAIIFFVFGCFWIALSVKEKHLNWQFLKYCCLFFLLSSPSLLYYLWLSNIHWLTNQRIAQAMPAVLTPPLSSFLVGYGLLWPLAFTGIYAILKNKKTNNISLFLIIWFFAQIILVYSPIPLQRKMIEGLHIVISILAVYGLFFLYPLLNKIPGFLKTFFGSENKFTWLFIFIIFFTLSNIYIIFCDMIFNKPSAMRISQDKIIAMRWLREKTPEDSMILSLPTINSGNLIPAFAVRTVYVGHGCETAYFHNKRTLACIFFKTNSYDKYKQTFLKKNLINYIFFGKEEKEFGNFQPEEKSYLKKVFENGEVKIFEVIYE